MAHEIKESDIQEGRTQAWHGLTQVKPDLSLENCHLANKTRDVIHVPLFRQNGEAYTPLLTGDIGEDGKPYAYHVLVCGDTGQQVGQPFNPYSFRPPSNLEFLEVIKGAVKDVAGITLESCGTVMSRNRVFFSFKVEGIEAHNVGGRTFQPFLNFGRGFDKSNPIWCNTSNICTVCNNTFQLNTGFKSPGIQVKIKQTKNVILRLENMKDVIDRAIGLQAEFNKVLADLHKTKANETEAREFFTGFLTGDKPAEISTRAENTVNRLVELFRGGAGNKGQTRLDMFQAGTDYYTHESSGGDNRLKQFVSSEFGAGNRMKGELLPLLTDGKAWANTRKIGAESVALTSKIQVAVNNAIASAKASIN